MPSAFMRELRVAGFHVKQLGRRRYLRRPSIPLVSRADIILFSFHRFEFLGCAHTLESLSFLSARRVAIDLQSFPARRDRGSSSTVARGDHRAFDDVLQLAHVARPAIGFQPADAIRERALRSIGPCSWRIFAQMQQLEYRYRRGARAAAAAGSETHSADSINLRETCPR